MPSNRTPSPALRGAVAVGNGTWPTMYLRSVGQATRLKQRTLARSTALGSPFTYTIVPVYGDGTVAGNNASAKTYLQGRSLKQLKGPRIPSAVAKALRT